MRFLLDTHTFLWFIEDDRRLSNRASRLIEEPVNQPLLSVMSLWEMAIKMSLGKLASNRTFKELVAIQVQNNEIALLQISPEHLDVLTTLPFHHKDPFDRLLIAQSIAEDVPILSRDTTFDRYSIQRLWE